MNTSLFVRTLVAFAAATPITAQDWSQIVSAASPGARHSAVMATDATNHVVLFGGTVLGLPYPAAYPHDTWTFDGATWTDVTPTSQPPQRIWHAMAFDAGRNRVVLYGGVGMLSLGLHTDTWEWDGANWTEIVTANSPGARLGLSMTHDLARGRTVVFGGFASSLLPTPTGTWEFDGVDWQQVPTTADPGARRHAAMAYLPGQGTVLAGGAASDETWLYDGTNWAIEPHAQQPPSLFSASFVLDAAANELVLFGGNPSGTSYVDPFDRTWIYNGAMGWRELHPATRPGFRSAQASGFLPGHGVVVHGGYANSTLGNRGDTWVLGGSRGSYATYGIGCMGAGDVVTLAPQSGSVPDLGATLHLDLANLATGPALFVMFSSFARAMPAIDLTPYGLTACASYLPLGPGVIPDLRVHAGGTGTWSLMVPATTGLLGVTMHNQALSIDSGAANPASAAVSNAGVAVIGQ